MKSRFFLLALVLLLPLAACKDKEIEKKNSTPPSPDLGEPIGAELPAKGTTPAMSLAIAVTKGQDPVAVMPKVVGNVATAVNGCPSFVTEEKENIVAINFTIEGGKMKPLPRAANESAGVKCVVAALDQKEAGAATLPNMNGRVEIKVNNGAAVAKP
jgi:hypothetical protein